LVKPLLEGGGETRFHVRLMGTELVEILKQEGKDRFIGQLDLGGFESVWRESLLCSYTSKMPVVALDRVRMNNGFELEFEHLVLPLSHDGSDIDRIFGCFDFPRFSDEWLTRNLDEVHWAGPVQIEVPKRLVISQLDVPPQ